MKETIYRQKDGISSRRLGDGLMLYDPHTDRIHTLNETGACVWELLDGANTIEGIEGILKRRFEDASPQKVSQDVAEILEKLRQEGLIASQV